MLYVSLSSHIDRSVHAGMQEFYVAEYVILSGCNSEIKKNK